MEPEVLYEPVLRAENTCGDGSSADLFLCRLGIWTLMVSQITYIQKGQDFYIKLVYSSPAFGTEHRICFRLANQLKIDTVYDFIIDITNQLDEDGYQFLMERSGNSHKTGEIFMNLKADNKTGDRKTTKLMTYSFVMEAIDGEKLMNTPLLFQKVEKESKLITSSQWQKATESIHGGLLEAHVSYHSAMNVLYSCRTCCGSEAEL